MESRVYVRDWIVISGGIINTTKGGGYEFFGPFTEAEAVEVRDELRSEGNSNEITTTCIQLLKLPNMLGEHWNPRQKPQYHGEDL